jgi:hypothetical protein
MIADFERLLANNPPKAVRKLNFHNDFGGNISNYSRSFT